jgi:hypothetical protein
MEKVKLSKKGLQNDIESGLTRVLMAEKYGLSTAQIANAIKQTGLTGLRAKYVPFEIVADEEVIEAPVEAPIVEVPEVKEVPAVKAPMESPTAPFSGIVVENEEEN